MTSLQNMTESVDEDYLNHNVSMVKPNKLKKTQNNTFVSNFNGKKLINKYGDKNPVLLEKLYDAKKTLPIETKYKEYYINPSESVKKLIKRPFKMSLTVGQFEIPIETKPYELVEDVEAVCKNILDEIISKICNEEPTPINEIVIKPNENIHTFRHLLNQGIKPRIPTTDTPTMINAKDVNFDFDE